MTFPFSAPEHPSWVYPKWDRKWKEKIIHEFNIHPVIAQVLVSRGFDSLDAIHSYLYSKLPDLHDPFLLAEMPQAVDRISLALEREEGILIYGDNDVDGMTGTALLLEFLQLIGANALSYVSKRNIRRENLIVEALEYAVKNECKLLITVDCGITAAEEIAKVAGAGVDVIVTDHHEPTDTIPHCVATLNPKLYRHSYPNQDLTGVGVAFKLAHAMTEHLVIEGRISSSKVDLKRYLDLVALGTISDMGALLEENRILVGYGLRQLRLNDRPGLAELFSVADLDPNDVTAYTLATKIIPRLNSLGRIDNPQKGVEMLLIREKDEAKRLAIDLDLKNIERQRIEKLMVADAEHILLDHPEILKSKAIVLHAHNWHPGIIAILSNRVSKCYNRPTVIISVDNGIGKGSLRSTHEFPLLDFLKKCSDLLMNFGGHDFAAGMTLAEENIPEFRKRFIHFANVELSDQDVQPKIYLDAKVDFNELTFEFMESIQLLEPYGNENPPPLFYADTRQTWPPKVTGRSNLKLYLRQDERMFEGIAFNRAALLPKLKRKNMQLRVAFTPQINNYLGQSIQLLVKDIHQKNDLPEELLAKVP